MRPAIGAVVDMLKIVCFMALIFGVVLLLWQLAKVASDDVLISAVAAIWFGAGWYSFYTVRVRDERRKADRSCAR